jgi:adenylosuccinate lyase
LKALTRGKGINEVGLREFITDLALPDDAKQRLLAMTPRSYVGLAVELARTV